MSWKLSCPVLRGGESGDARTLPDLFSNLIQCSVPLAWLLLGVELEPVNIGSALFLKKATHYLSKVAIDRNFTVFIGCSNIYA
jgi:hypothetical protein